MPQISKIAKEDTEVIRTPEKITVLMYNVPIVEVTATHVRLNHGGFHTMAVKNRMNQAANELGLGLHVNFSKKKWHVVYRERIIPFKYNLLTLSRAGF